MKIHESIPKGSTIATYKATFIFPLQYKSLLHDPHQHHSNENKDWTQTISKCDQEEGLVTPQRLFAEDDHVDYCRVCLLCVLPNNNGNNNSPSSIPTKLCCKFCKTFHLSCCNSKECSNQLQSYFSIHNILSHDNNCSLQLQGQNNHDMRRESITIELQKEDDEMSLSLFLQKLHRATHPLSATFTHPRNYSTKRTNSKGIFRNCDNNINNNNNNEYFPPTQQLVHFYSLLLSILFIENTIQISTKSFTDAKKTKDADGDDYNDEDNDNDMTTGTTNNPHDEMISNFINKCLYKTNNETKSEYSYNHNIDENTLQCWTFLRNYMNTSYYHSQIQNNINTTTSNHESTNNTTKLNHFISQLYTSPHLLYALGKDIQNSLVPITNNQNPSSIHLLPNESNTTSELRKKWNHLKNLFLINSNSTDNSHPVLKSLLINKGEMNHDDCTNDIEHLKCNNDEIDDLTLWRLMTRITQSFQRQDSQDEKDFWNVTSDSNKKDDDNANREFQIAKIISGWLSHKLQRHHLVFVPEMLDIKHSCIPNCIYEQVETFGVSPCCVRLVALHDIHQGDSLTVSKIDNLSGDIGQRSSLLKEVFGPSYVCVCVRCRCEQLWNDRGKFRIIIDDNYVRTCKIANNQDEESKYTFHWRELKQLGDLAMQHGRYEDAKDMYDLILEVQPTNGDILHARCASLLEQGYFVTAQEMWKEAIKKCPKHNGILLHVKKQDAYRPLALENAPLDQNGNINSSMFDTIIPNKCFMTKPDQPLLTLKECKQIIEWSEAAAAEQGQGWTTSRHYAVPTTDIPVHEIPRVLSLFNSILTNKLRPLLALQFGEDQLGVNGCNLHIHDAFVVRYDGGGGQRYLPLHRDQSTHSFTIALNDTSEYDGGGTFVCHLGRAIKPNIGGVVSFRGDELLHGGDPVLSGRRYIIVGFCYANKISDKLKRKHDELDQWFVRHKKVKGNGSSHQSQGVNSAVSNKNEGFAFDFQI